VDESRANPGTVKSLKRHHLLATTPAGLMLDVGADVSADDHSRLVLVEAKAVEACQRAKHRIYKL
jgi:hypothetical protein